MKRVRCAIYTRKSSEEGLEQDFNSLHAQREACAAYLLSQAGEGWSLLPETYDDGGLSGGTLERPALQRLLADVAAVKIDIVVVYKVDRLTRSLLDFARLVEAFDKAGVSFVSVTQSFNTTTSMGRLTLNMLLSFAQFEREVTAERIRDKIAASKAKGMWMGGNPPLGYRPDGRSLAIVEEHAAIVRDIFARYLASGNVRVLASELDAEAIRVPQRTAATGRVMGGGAFSRGQLYKILSNPIYLGKVHHQGKVYAGKHPAIIACDLWDQVQARLAGNLQGGARHRDARTSLLAGLIVGSEGEPLVASHASKQLGSKGAAAKVRYRYYVSRNLQHAVSSSGAGQRIPAPQIEGAVCDRLAEALDDPLGLLAAAGLPLDPAEIRITTSKAPELAAKVRIKNSGLIRALVAQVQVLRNEIRIDLQLPKLVTMLGVGTPEHLTVTITAPVRLTRTGMAMRLIQSNGKAVVPRQPDPKIVRLLLQAKAWWSRLADGSIDITNLAREQGINDSWVTRVVRLNFLAPSLVEAILAGDQQAVLNADTLLTSGPLPLDWRDQEATLGAA